MKKLFTVILLTSLMATGAYAHDHKKMPTKGEQKEMHVEGPMKLKDGSLLFVNEDGTMRMVDKMGKPMSMKEGVEMDMEDGSTMLMHNKKMFRHVHKSRP